MASKVKAHVAATVATLAFVAFVIAALNAPAVVLMVGALALCIVLLAGLYWSVYDMVFSG